MKILLIFEFVSDKTEVYLLDVNQEEYQKLSQCHGVYGNSDGIDDDHPVNTWLPNWLETKQECMIVQSETAAKDSPVRLPDNNNVVLILTGFLC